MSSKLLMQLFLVTLLCQSSHEFRKKCDIDSVAADHLLLFVTKYVFFFPIHIFFYLKNLLKLIITSYIKFCLLVLLALWFVCGRSPSRSRGNIESRVKRWIFYCLQYLPALWSGSITHTTQTHCDTTQQHTYCSFFNFTWFIEKYKNWEFNQKHCEIT